VKAFGSFVSGLGSSESDIDLVITGNGKWCISAL
jgi:DNA polymerase sigma